MEKKWKLLVGILGLGTNNVWFSMKGYIFYKEGLRGLYDE